MTSIAKIFRFFPVVLTLILVGYPLSAIGGYNNIFLLIPQGPRESAMGETGVSHSKSGASAFWNPALISNGGPSVQFQFFQLIEDAQGSFGGLKLPFSWGGIGFYYMTNGIDGFEARQRPGTPEAEFSIHQTVFAGSGAYKIADNLSVGFSYKTAMENIYGSRWIKGDIFDIGGYYRIRYWSVGISILNFEINKNEDHPSPSSYRLGLSRELFISEYELTFAVEGVSLDGEEAYLHFGAEASWNRIVSLRGGYMTGHDSRTLSVGFGAEFDHYEADISITPFQNEFDTVWRIGLSINL